MAVARANVLVDLSGSATLAAANAALALAIAGLAAGFLPEDVDVMTFRTDPDGVTRDCLALVCGEAPFQDWIAVTVSAVVLVDLNGLATVAAAQAAIDAELATQDLAGLQLRSTRYIRLALGGAQHDLCALIFSDGAPATT